MLCLRIKLLTKINIRSGKTNKHFPLFTFLICFYFLFYFLISYRRFNCPFFIILLKTRKIKMLTVRGRVNPSSFELYTKKKNFKMYRS